MQRKLIEIMAVILIMLAIVPALSQTSESLPWKTILSYEGTSIAVYDYASLLKAGETDIKFGLDCKTTTGTKRYLWLDNEELDANSSVGNFLVGAQFVSSSNVWLITRVGHALNRACLFDILTGKVKRYYEGKSFWISPEGNHIFYSEFNLGNANLYCDGYLIFPSSTDAYSTSHTVVNDVRILPSYGQFIKAIWMEKTNDNSMLEECKWLSNNEFFFRVSENDGLQHVAVSVNVKQLAGNIRFDITNNRSISDKGELEYKKETYSSTRQRVENISFAELNNFRKSDSNTHIVNH